MTPQPQQALHGFSPPSCLVVTQALLATAYTSHMSPRGSGSHSLLQKHRPARHAPSRAKPSAVVALSPTLSAVYFFSTDPRVPIQGNSGHWRTLRRLPNTAGLHSKYFNLTVILPNKSEMSVSRDVNPVKCATLILDSAAFLISACSRTPHVTLNTAASIYQTFNICHRVYLLRTIFHKTIHSDWH